MRSTVPEGSWPAGLGSALPQGGVAAADAQDDRVGRQLVVGGAIASLVGTAAFSSESARRASSNPPAGEAAGNGVPARLTSESSSLSGPFGPFTSMLSRIAP